MSLGWEPASTARCVVGMSGGVDSSVAALQMLRDGYEVIGAHLATGLPLQDPNAAAQDLDDARTVADVLGIELVERGSSELFTQQVLGPAMEQYAAGLTPNPCVTCNRRFKLAELLRLADSCNAQVVATGHYARLLQAEDGTVKLLRGLDITKDQSYFLHRLHRRQLCRLNLPLGTKTKAEVRRIAAAAGLPVVQRAESQELCFIPQGKSYAELLEEWLPDRLRTGDIVDRSGRRLGSHGGIHRFTIGQRRGIGVSAAAPLYVLELDPVDGTVVVGGVDELLVGEVQVEEMRWTAGSPPAATFECTVQVRSSHREVAAHVETDGERALVLPATPLRAPAPGQAAVLYRNEEVLGGGWISRPT